MTDLTPGPEMDRAVAEAVGFTVHEKSRDDCRVYRPGTRDLVFFRPSRDMTHTIEALEATGHWFVISASTLRHEGAVTFRYQVDLETGRETRKVIMSGCKPTLPEAACRAILAWAEAKEKNDG